MGAACLQGGKPVAYASRTLTDTETKYAQIKKELLAVVFACSKFSDCIYGKPVTIETDHQPLVTTLKKPIHAAPARLQRMMLRLQKYDLTLLYKSGKLMYVADTLSRASRSLTAQEVEEEDSLEMMMVNYISSSWLLEFKEYTATNTTLQTLSSIVRHGSSLPHDIHSYYPFRDELIVENGLIMKGHTVRLSVQSLYRKIILALYTEDILVQKQLNGEQGELFSGLQ